MRILGIDLAGKEENPSGICTLEKYDIELSTVYNDNNILEIINVFEPHLIVIDAPLSFPKGRCCLEKDCKCATGGHFRQAERDMRRYGPVLPLTFKGMKMLTLRGIKLASILKKDYGVLESHPRTNQKILKFNDARAGLKKYFRISPIATEHELDAGILALTGYLFLKDCCIELGDNEEGVIIIPKDVKCLNMLKFD